MNALIQFTSYFLFLLFVTINHIFFKFNPLVLCNFLAATFPVLGERILQTFHFLASIVTIFKFISSPSAVTCSLNSFLFDLLIFMLVLVSVQGEFLSWDFTNLFSFCSLVCFFSFCLALNVVLHSVQLQQCNGVSLGIIGAMINYIPVTFCNFWSLLPGPSLLIFKASALWADAFIEWRCQSICLSADGYHTSQVFFPMLQTQLFGSIKPQNKLCVILEVQISYYLQYK